MARIKYANWGAVEELLDAAATNRARLSETVDHVGLEDAMNIICAELSLRCDPPQLDQDVHLQLQVMHGRDSSYRTLAIGRTALSCDEYVTNNALPLLRFEVCDLLSSLFGSEGDNRLASREIVWPDILRRKIAEKELHGGTLHTDELDRMVLGLEAVLKACRQQNLDLNDLAVRFGSNKWASIHWYTQHYEKHFETIRDRSIRFLEIGVGTKNSPSLHMWQRYFRRGLIYGLDIKEFPTKIGPRIQFIQGSQNDADLLAEVGKTLGPFDIIIDDGSHVNEHVKTSLNYLLPHVNPGGLYVIEDLLTAYLPRVGGSYHNLLTSDTSTVMLKNMVDGLNYEEIQGRAQSSDNYTDKNVTALHFYHNLAIIEKGNNSEGSIIEYL